MMGIKPGDVDTNTQYLRDIAESMEESTGDASLASIAAGMAALSGAGLSYLGKDRTTTTGAAEEMTISEGATKVLLTCPSGGEGFIELNGDATTGSPICISEIYPIWLDLGGVTKLSAWAVAGSVGAVFFGQGA